MRGAVIVYEKSGELFTLLHRAKIGVPLWRADAEHAEPINARLAVVAADLTEPAITTIARRLPTVIVATDPTDESALEAMRDGAIGYIGARRASGSFRRAIHAALRGEVVYPRRVLLTAIRSSLGARPGPMTSLTPRQHEVLALISQGATDKQIAMTLNITAATVQKHAANLRRRLGVPNRAAAAARAGVA